MFQREPYAIGGAERQMGLLALEMARRGHEVSLVVFPVTGRRGGLPDRLRLVERRERAPTSEVFGAIREAVRIARALHEAGGRVVIVRSGTPVLGIVGLYCRLRRRRLIFSSANDFDFVEGGRVWDRPWTTSLYALGVRCADTVVVQSDQQLRLARERFPRIRRLVRVPSFVELPPDVAAPATATAFYWVGRPVDYKRPLRFVDLAAAVPEATFVLVLQTREPTSKGGEEVDLEAQVDAAVSRTPNLAVQKNVPHAVLSEALGQAVAMVNTSSYEGMPNTFLEAWSRGAPVLSLSFDPDGIIEQHGLGIAAGGAWERFVAGARELWANRDRRDEASRRVRTYVEQVHSMKTVGTAWESLIGAPEAGTSPEEGSGRG